MFIFTTIGICWTSIFIFKRRGWFMDRDLFFNEVKNLRSNLLNGYCNSASETLDDLVEVVMGTEENKVTPEQSLEEEVANVIKKIKKAKENEKLRSKSKELIEQIKKSLED